MVYSTEGPWGLEGLALSTDNLGRPSIVIELDAAGAKRMHELTAPHVGEPLAIVAKEHVYSAPILQSPLGKYVMITGGFVEDEVRRLHDQLRESLVVSSQGE